MLWRATSPSMSPASKPPWTRQKAEARKAWSGSGDAATDAVWFEVRDEVGASEFLGYDTESAEGRITALVVDGKPTVSAVGGTDVAVVLNQTPFYGESGGQMGDVGRISTETAEITITDTQKRVDDVIVHIGKVSKGKIAVGDEARLEVDHDRRSGFAPTIPRHTYCMKPCAVTWAIT